MTAQSTLLESEIARSHVVCAYSLDCVKILDAHGAIQFFNDNGLQLMGIADFLDVKGLYWPTLWPSDGRNLAEQSLQTAREFGVASFIAACPTIQGTPKWWDVTVAALPGVELSFVVVSRDITADQQTKHAERATLDHIRMVTSTNADVLWDIDLVQDKVWWSEGLQSTFGYGAEQIGDTTKWCHEHIHPDDRARVVQSMEDAVGDGSATWEGEFRYLRADGEYVDVFDRGTIIRNANDEALRFVGVMQDVTARKAATARDKLVTTELAHRINNTLAVVTGLFHQSVRTCADVTELNETFTGRLLAMANANTAILRGGGSAAILDDIARSQLAPYIGAGRLHVDGPLVVLSEQFAQPVALALNELATNALKHGALSTPEGSVDLTWVVRESDAERRVIIRWIEAGGPTVSAPTRVGMGSKLIENGIRGAIVERRFDPDGFRCLIEFPV